MKGRDLSLHAGVALDQPILQVCETIRSQSLRILLPQEFKIGKIIPNPAYAPHLRSPIMDHF